MDVWAVLGDYLPTPWVTTLTALSPAVREAVQEVRLRAGEPVTVSLPHGDRYLGAHGLTALPDSGVLVCDSAALERIFLRFCDESVYAHEWELAQGYIAVRGGIRVGVAGTAVTEAGAVCRIRSVTSLCIRLPRRLSGCAAALIPWVDDGRLHNTVLVGEPSSGKTTLLRDLAVTLATRRRVAVVDERGELAGSEGLRRCDVLRGYPKAEGLEQAVRCLAPEVVLFDELGTLAEAQAVAALARRGVAVVTTLHGEDLTPMATTPLIRTLISTGAFSRWVMLSGRHRPGEWRGCYRPEVTPNGMDWLSVDGGGGSGTGTVRCPPLAPPRCVFTEDGGAVADGAGTAWLQRPANERAVAAVGTE